MGRPFKLQAEQEAVLTQIVESDPNATLDEIGAELFRRTGVKVYRQTLATSLSRIGLVCLPSNKAVVVTVAAPQSKRYGYTDSHRRLEPEQTYPSCLTDVEWALVGDIFEREGGRGLPLRVDRRALVDACIYIVRTGCALRMLP